MEFTGEVEVGFSIKGNVTLLWLHPIYRFHPLSCRAWITRCTYSNNFVLIFQFSVLKLLFHLLLKFTEVINTISASSKRFLQELLKNIQVCVAKTASSFLSGTERHSGLFGGRTSVCKCKSSWTVKRLDTELPEREDKTSLISTFDQMGSVCASDPLLMTGGEVGDMEGQALLAGGGRGGGGGGVDESCPSSSEELSSVRSMTSTFLLLPPPLLSLLLWLDEEEPCWSAPADVRHEPAE